MGKASCHTRRGTSKPKKLLTLLSTCHFVLEHITGLFRIGIERGSETSDSLQISRMSFKARLLCYIFSLCLFLPCRKLQLPELLLYPGPLESKRMIDRSWQRSSLSNDTTRRYFCVRSRSEMKCNNITQIFYHERGTESQAIPMCGVLILLPLVFI